MHPDDDYLRPLPWPVKKAILYLMNLPSDCTEANYKERWQEIFGKDGNGINHNQTVLDNFLSQIMRDEKCDYTKACSYAMQTAHGRRLIAAAGGGADPSSKSASTNSNQSEVAARSVAFNRRVDELMKPKRAGARGLTFDEAIDEMRLNKDDRTLLAAMGYR